MTLTVTSEAFTDGQPLPRQYAYKPEGQNISPQLSWSGGPEGVEQYAMIMDDPDAPGGTWVHWVLYNIPAEAGKQSLPIGPISLGQMREGVNSWNETGYGGPLPPPGKPHRYFFKVYALDKALDLPAGLTKAELLSKIEPHVIAQGRLFGTYQR